MSPRPRVLAEQPVRTQLSAAAIILGSLVAVLATSWLSILTQPAALVSAAWWPAAGIALGLGIRFPRRYTWALAFAVSAITLPVVLGAGRPTPLAIALSVAVGVEMAVGTLMLRGRQDVLPTLSSPRELGRLLVSVISAAVVYDLLAAGATLLLADPADAWTRLVTSGPKHAAGMLLIVPYFAHLPRRPRQAALFETIAQIATTLAVTTFVFVINDRLPFAFLPFVPLVWAALRLSTRLLLVEMLAVAVIASIGSSLGDGPFSFERLGPWTGTLVLQIFELAMVVVFLALSLAVGLERDTAARLNESEELFRTIFDTSVAGMMIAIQDASGWSVQRSNASAAAILPALSKGERQLFFLLGANATQAVSTQAVKLSEGNALLTVTTDLGRNLNISLSRINDSSEGQVVALQFHDVTEAMRVRRLERQELERAGEVQRALSPGRLAHTPGWSSGALSVPATQVGGDFYDLRVLTVTENADVSFTVGADGPDVRKTLSAERAGSSSLW